jgi:Trypsin-like peptidase domain
MPLAIGPQAMTHRLVRLCIVSLVFATGLTGCGSAADPEEIGKLEQKAIREPASTRVAEALGPNKTVLDPSSEFDDRRDAWEDENPATGEDPERWAQKGHQFGYQWLRSYARNAAFAFFEDTDFIDVGDGTKKLKLLRETGDSAHVAELALDAKGFGLCPEKRFADQINQGATGPAECSGTLIDSNLMLTAAHCVRRQFDFTLKHTSLDKVRVALSYVFSERGQIVSAGSGKKDPREIHFVPGRDIFRVREVLTMNVDTIDFSILQLLDESGNPIDSVDPRYSPVPLWESTTPPLGPKFFRPAGVIGVGARLPQKIALSRSKGWETDPQFLGIAVSADIFAGNSGGGVYDAETGTLIGVVHAEFEHELFVTCPAVAATVNPWPFCPTVSQGQVQPAPLALVRVPEFDGLAQGGPKAKGCSKWIPQKWPDTEKTAFVDFVKQNFTVDDAKVDLAGPPAQDAVAVSVPAVRSLACGAANAPGSLQSAVLAQAQNAIALRVAAQNNGSQVCSGDQSFSFCPSATVVGDLPQPPVPLFATSLSDNDAKTVLRNSRLCAGTVAPPRATLWSDLPRIRPEFGRETTYHGTTTAGVDYFPIDKDDGATPDMLYRIEVTDWTLLYADTFSGGRDITTRNSGTNFDTMLFMMEATNATDTDPFVVATSWQLTGPPFDDSRCGASDANRPFDFAVQTQLVDVLQPGKKYILGVTGFGGTNGKFNLHVQAVPGVRNGQLLRQTDVIQRVNEAGVNYNIFSAKPFVPATAKEQNCVDQNGAFDPNCVYNTQPPIRCQRTDSGDVGFVSVSCPEFHSPQFRFKLDGTSIPLGSTYDDDAVGEFWEGQLRHETDGYVCSDDSKVTVPFTFTFPFPFTFQFTLDTHNSEIGHRVQVHADSAQTALTSGAGIRTFYAHQFQIFMNWPNLRQTLKLPDGASNDIWTR